MWCLFDVYNLELCVYSACGLPGLASCFPHNWGLLETASWCWGLLANTDRHELAQYHGCWCPGSLHRQDINNLYINYACSLEPCLWQGRIFTDDIKNNAWVTVNNDFLVTSENHWQITSRVTKISLFLVTNVLFYFLHAVLCHSSAKNDRRSFSSPLSPTWPMKVFSALALWRHHSWSVTSRVRKILAL